jgi:hypothetical protein
MLTILKEAMNIGLKSCSSICHSDFKPPILFKSVIGQLQIQCAYIDKNSQFGENGNSQKYQESPG